MLWALEKIDARLPKRVRKDYEHRLTGNTYLIDLQVTIFQSIPSMLEDMNKQAELHALTTATNPETSLNAFRPKQGFMRGSSTRGGRGAGKGSERRAYSKLFCRVCHSAGKPAQIYQSHNVGNCGFFNSKDRKDMFVSLKAMNLEEDDDDTAWTVESEDLEHGEQDNSGEEDDAGA